MPKLIQPIMYGAVILLSSNSFSAVLDVDCNNQEGLAEAIHALQVTAGHNPGLPDCIPTVTSLTGKVWMDRNLGASQAATSSSDTEAYGDLYQWGRGADGHEKRDSVTTTVTSPSHAPGHSLYIFEGTILFGEGSVYNWMEPKYDYLWQGAEGINNPCPVGFRLPTAEEWEAEKNSWDTSTYSDIREAAFNSPLKLVLAGYRSTSSGRVYNEGIDGNYWSGTPDGDSSRSAYFYSDIATMFSDSRAFGYSVRCIKDQGSLMVAFRSAFLLCFVMGTTEKIARTAYSVALWNGYRSDLSLYLKS